MAFRNRWILEQESSCAPGSHDLSTILRMLRRERRGLSFLALRIIACRDSGILEQPTVRTELGGQRINGAVLPGAVPSFDGLSAQKRTAGIGDAVALLRQLREKLLEIAFPTGEGVQYRKPEQGPVRVTTGKPFSRVRIVHLYIYFQQSNSPFVSTFITFFIYF